MNEVKSNRAWRLECEKLRAFYKEVSYLARDHEVLDDHAVVFVASLAVELENIDPEWWKEGH